MRVCVCVAEIDCETKQRLAAFGDAPDLLCPWETSPACCHTLTFTSPPYFPHGYKSSTPSIFFFSHSPTLMPVGKELEFLGKNTLNQASMKAICWGFTESA